MTWQATFQADTELPDVGTVSAVWTDADGSTFSVPAQRVDQKTGIAKFITDARAQLAAYQAKRTRVATIAAKITDALNA